MILDLWSTARWLGVSPQALRKLTELDHPFPMNQYGQTDTREVMNWLGEYGVRVGAEAEEIR